eukprot:4988621-Prymnesium_polylepis.1
MPSGVGGGDGGHGDSGGCGGLGGERSLSVTSRFTHEPSHSTSHVRVPIGGRRSAEYESAAYMHDPSLSRSYDLLASGALLSRIHIA